MLRERLSPFYNPKRLLLAATVAGMALLGCSDNDTDSRGGCEAFRVYAQNRWDPLGTAVREEPNVLASKLDPSFAPNEVIAVDGWLDTGEPVYPTNPAPWNSGIWFRLANREGWISFAGVRGEPTTPDPTGLSDDGGLPALPPKDCEVEF